jgi:uncharacterized membrane protein YccF (DUF307 family)
MKTLSVTFVIAVFALVLFWPFALIWAVNTLFATAIPYTFWTWLAAMVMMAAFGKTHVKVEQK